MKLIISGSRNLTDYNIIREAVFEWAKSIHGDNIPLPLNSWIDEIIEGGCETGIDRLAEKFCKEQKIDHTRFNANWHKFGKSAGPKRNQRMGKYLLYCKELNQDEVYILAIPESTNGGTANMVGVGKRLEIPVFVYDKYIKND